MDTEQSKHDFSSEPAIELSSAAGKKRVLWLSLAVVLALVVVFLVVNFALIREVPPPATLSIPEQEELIGDAMAAQDKALCANVTDAELRTVCINNVILAQVQHSGDAALCTEVDGTLISQVYCEQLAVAALSSSEATTPSAIAAQCQALSSDIAKQQCLERAYSSLALSAGDPTQCDQLAAYGQEADVCHDQVSLQLYIASLTATSDTSTLNCDSLRQESVRADCTNTLEPHAALIQAMANTAAESTPADLPGDPQTLCQALQSPLAQQLFCQAELTNTLGI